MTKVLEPPRILTPEEVVAYEAEQAAKPKSVTPVPWYDEDPEDWGAYKWEDPAYWQRQPSYGYSPPAETAKWPEKLAGEEEIIPGSPSERWDPAEVIYMAQTDYEVSLTAFDAALVLAQCEAFVKDYNAEFDRNLVEMILEETVLAMEASC